MANGSIADITDRLVLARVGWCEFYNGTLGDEPVAGGTYNDSGAGSEWHNFRVIGGRVYGVTRPTQETHHQCNLAFQRSQPRLSETHRHLRQE